MRQRLNSRELAKRMFAFAMALGMTIATVTIAYAPSVNSVPQQTSEVTFEHFEQIPDEDQKADVVLTAVKNQVAVPGISPDMGRNNAQAEENVPAEEEKVYPLLSEIDENSPTKERILALFGFFISEGFTPEASAGIIGNIAIESGFNPTVTSGNGHYHGLCQWNSTNGGGHWWDGSGGIVQWLNSNGYAWNSFEGQAKAIVYCQKKGFLTGKNFEKFKNMTSIEEATSFFCKKYEVGSGISKRISEARFAYELYQNPEGEYAGNKYYIVK